MVQWHTILKTPRVIKHAMNVWPPFTGAGIVIEDIAPDFRSLTVALKDRLWNRNYVGSHFGGSLFAMTDPFYMLLYINILGPEYFVWDTGADISFLKPAYKTVRVHFRVSDDDIARIKSKTADGQKHEEVFVVEIVTEAGEVVARVTKRLYFRLKPRYRPKGEA